MNASATFSLFLQTPLAQAHLGKTWNNTLPPSEGFRRLQNHIQSLHMDNESGQTGTQKVAISDINGTNVMSLIFGPPGTGKTAVIAKAMQLRNGYRHPGQDTRYYTVVPGRITP